MTPDTTRLGLLTVLTTEGAAVPVALAWEDAPVVLVWLRHFG